MPTADELRVMTFNLRVASGEPVHPWPERRPVVGQLLARTLPHVLGTQEGLPDQLREVAADLPASYDSVGEGREGGGRGEEMRVFFDTTRLRLVAHGHYWLSDTPEVPGSMSWGGEWPRMVTWAHLVDLATGSGFQVLNTHLEAFSAAARARSAALIASRLPTDVPVLLTGDVNEPAVPGTAVYDALVSRGPLIDTWAAARHRGPAYGTFHDYEPLVPDGDRIDWILSTPDVSVSWAGVDTFSAGETMPSDHLPVRAVVRVPTRAPLRPGRRA
jgi:endonuclease/exonuclease/phosphatase family metal-dependent hydrolase